MNCEQSLSHNAVAVEVDIKNESNDDGCKQKANSTAFGTHLAILVSPHGLGFATLFMW